VQVLLQVAQQSLELPCVAHSDHQEAYLAGGKITQAQRNQLQVCKMHDRTPQSSSKCCATTMHFKGSCQ
jgi:hypothetical protein